MHKKCFFVIYFKVEHMTEKHFLWQIVKSRYFPMIIMILL